MQSKKIQNITKILVATFLLATGFFANMLCSILNVNATELESNEKINELETQALSENDIGFVPVAADDEDEDMEEEVTAESILSSLNGSGTESSPYLIYTAADLKLVSDAYAKDISTVYYFQLQNDIDLSEYEWMSIGDGCSENCIFDGSFDGNSYTVTLMNHQTEEENEGEGTYDYQSLFANNKGIIKNLNIICTQGGNTSAPVCWINYGTIENCHISGVMEEFEYEMTDWCISGVSHINHGTIKNCSVKINFKGICNGITDSNYGTIENCIIDSNIQGGDVTGITGYNTGTISNCQVKGKFGIINAGYGTGAVGVNEGTIKNTICSAEILYEGEKENGCSAMGFVDSNGTKEYVNGEEVVTTGIINDCSFTGTIKNFYDTTGFVGKNYGAISKCYVTTDLSVIQGEESCLYERLCAGFAQYNWGSIEECYVEGNISCTADVGEAAGFCLENLERGVISKSYFKGNMTQSNTESNWNAGAIGAITKWNDGIIQQCYAEGNIYVEMGKWIGGLVGNNGENGKIQKCYWKGEIYNHNSKGYSVDIGGIVGVNYGLIEECLAKGKIVRQTAVTSENSTDIIGGIVGYNYADEKESVLLNCMADVEVINTFKTDKINLCVGGITGWIHTSPNAVRVKNCYAIGMLPQEYTTLGGLCAQVSKEFLQESNFVVENCFFNSVYPSTTATNSLDVGTAKTIQELRNKNTYTAAGWDFTNVWNINKNKNEGFPYLRFAENIFENQTYYTATVTATSGGKITPNGTFEIYQGEDYDFKIEPSSGYEIQDVIVNGISQGSITNYRLLNVGKNTTVQAVFKKVSTENTSNNIAPAKKGTKITDKTYSAKFTVTSADSKNPTVAYTGTTNKKKKTITIPGTITYQGIKYKVTSVSAKALKGNKKVTTVKIGSNVTKIGTSAFEGCTSLKTVTIGTGLKTIGKNAFKNCKKLKTITIKSSKLKTVGKNAFKGINSKCKIKVPSKKVKAYKKLMKGKGQKSTVKISK